jgi:predicted phage terminase large subunit-like protein
MKLKEEVIEDKIVKRIRKVPPLMSEDMLLEVIRNPYAIVRELNNRSLYHFLQYFWKVISQRPFQPNWHIEYICGELEKLAERVAKRLPREYDLIINIPPGSTKTLCVSIMFPAWCWTKWPWMRFITASYSAALALESAEYCRDLIRSTEFQEVYPEIEIKEDKDTKSNYKIVTKEINSLAGQPRIQIGGGRFSTSVGGTLFGFHGDIIIVDDPLNPKQAASDIELNIANTWMDSTVPTRKTDKAVTPTILIMQRLHMNDPTGYLLSKHKQNIKHICLPGDGKAYRSKINPPELEKYYVDGLLDPVRLPWNVLNDLKMDLGQYGYAGQIGQDPTPPGGGMFQVENFEIVDEIPHPSKIIKTVRYWDKAGTQDGGAYTVGVKMHQLTGGKWLIEDVRRGRWSTDKRESIIQATAMQDGTNTIVWLEQEPGSGGKESAQATIRNLAGFVVYSERPTGDKAVRADAYSVQVNNGGVLLLKAPWNHDFIEEHRFFPYSTYKDQVDAASGAFNKLIFKRECRRIT